MSVVFNRKAIFSPWRSTVVTCSIKSKSKPTRRLHVSSQTRNKSTPPFSTDGLPPHPTLYRRLLHAWRTTPTKWYPLPLSIGIGLLLLLQYRKYHLNNRYPSDSHADSAEVFASPGGDVLRLKGPLHIHVLGALPLRSMSRVWGYLNSLELPMWFRPFGFKLYAFIFGCNLDEIEPRELTAYKSLGEFFYRRLVAHARPIEDADLVSPADGKMLHFGTINDLRRVEQVKGITYSLDALLGSPHSSSSSTPPSTPPGTSAPDTIEIGRGHKNKDHSVVVDSQFANVNGIEYSLGQLIGGDPPYESDFSTKTDPNSSGAAADHHRPRRVGPETDASIPHETLGGNLSRDAQVAHSMGILSSVLPTSLSTTVDGTEVMRVPGLRPGNSLFFAVIYLAPGDYHRFHSPSAWVVERRRHFVGELFSVSPYMARRLQNLFVLNERVALLGRWTHGFFGMVPVGATNVGSIKVNFDSALRTNVRRPHRSAPPLLPGSYAEASYAGASSLLRGQALNPGEEMGGFCLGSTIVLVFEAPKRFEFCVREGDRVRVGQRLGEMPPDAS